MSEVSDAVGLNPEAWPQVNVLSENPSLPIGSLWPCPLLSLRVPGSRQEGQLGPFSVEEGEVLEQQEVVLQKVRLCGWMDSVIMNTKEKGTMLVFPRK